MSVQYGSPRVANPTIGAAGSDLPRRAVCSLLILVNLTVGALGAQASEITVAVASNFLAAESELARAFEAHSGHHVVTSSGSTGKLFAQIVQGAPFDIFLAADTVRPRKLVELGLAPESGLSVYATGRLALWSPAAQSADEVQSALLKKRYKYLALANPKTAPYGAAATEAMQALGLKSQKRLDGEGGRVFGENIAQCYQFVKTGHAELGFVALSQVIADSSGGAVWPVPEKLYQPLRQALVVVGASAKRQAVSSFLAFLKSSEAMAIIASYGYIVPTGIPTGAPTGAPGS